MTNQPKIKVGLIFGGRSGEHEVSLASAQSIMQAIDPHKYEIIPIGITKTGAWLTGSQTHQQLMDMAKGHPALPESPVSASSEAGQLALKMPNIGPLDVIFPVLHGTFGEDGTVQGLLELLDLPYVGAGVLASAVAMDKVMCKDIFRAYGLPQVAYQTVLRGQWQSDPEAVIVMCEAHLSYPMFVKPANLGSSVGIHKAKNQAQLRAGLSDAARYDRKLVVEQGISAREIEVSVLGNDDPIASVPGEIIPSREFYSYAAKYIDQNSQLLIPASLTANQVAEVQQLAITAFKALDGAGLARCDFFVEKETGHIYLNELNTMPGFTAISMYPKLWMASGLSYPDLIDRLLQLALARHQEKQQSQTTFDVTTAE